MRVALKRIRKPARRSLTVKRFDRRSIINLYVNLHASTVDTITVGTSHDSATHTGEKGANVGAKVFPPLIVIMGLVIFSISVEKSHTLQ